MSLLDRIRKALEPDYAVEREVGAGGMGVVFEALDTRLRRKVAVKVLKPELATAVAAERFLREAQLMARLKHPGVVHVHDADEGDGLSWFIMDLIEGETLQSRLRRGPLSARETIHLGRELLSALAAAHEQGIVHRDVKPANIFVEKGHALLADFGIARSSTTSGSDPGLTATQQQIGTPAYMSPEQRGGGDVGPASDQYSLALVLYECVSGTPWPPMQGPGSGDWAKVPSSLASALRQALSFEPAERWNDAATFASALGPRVNWRRWSVGTGLTAIAGVMAWVFLRPALCDKSAYAPGQDVTVPCRAYGSWTRAEGIFADGNWDAADTAFRSVLAEHPGCLACEFRLNEVNHWLERPPDSAAVAHLGAGLLEFKSPWRQLVSASLLPARDRLDSLERITVDFLDWSPGFYYLGSELFNRGGLFGRRRDEAIEAFEKHAAVSPRFVPAWTDRLLARIAIGDSAGAASSLSQILSLPRATRLAQAQRLVARLAFAFRFTPDGIKVWQEISQDPSVGSGLPFVGAGPRVLSGLGTPTGAVELGREFERSGQRPLQRSGLIAEMMGSVALGRLEEMRAAALRLNATFPSNEYLALPIMLEAMALLFDDETTPSMALAIEGALAPFTRRTMPPAVRRDAAWLTALAALRRRAPAAAAAAGELLEDDPPPSFRRAFIAAALVEASGDADSALRLTEPAVTKLELWDRMEPGALLRSAIRLSRARWYESLADPESARREYRWHQHFHLTDYPVNDPLIAEGDWAMSTLASWRQARLLDRDRSPGGPDSDVCGSYRLVLERWLLGDARYRARADTARSRLAALKCDQRA
jgi:serine/threonine protein kinase